MLKLPTRQTAPQSAKTLWKNANLKVRDFLNSMCFSGPSFLGMLIFYLVPFGVVIYYSFIAGVVDSSFVGLKNYIAVFNNAAFRTAAKNTAVFTGLAVPLAVVLSMLLALMLEARIPGKSQFRTCFLSPMMVPIASIILIWQVLFHSNGVVNEFLMVFGADKINWLKSDYCMVVIVSLFLWKNLGYNMILFMAALNNIPKELIEAAELDGGKLKDTKAFDALLDGDLKGLITTTTEKPAPNPVNPPKHDPDPADPVQSVG